MLIRNGFITNSSSCSFIAWGCKIDGEALDARLEDTLSVDEQDDFWGDMYNGIPVTLKACGYSGKVYAVIADSYKKTDDEDYIVFDPTVPEVWGKQLRVWCSDYGLACEDPQWFFATVGC